MAMNDNTGQRPSTTSFEEAYQVHDELPEVGRGVQQFKPSARLPSAKTVLPVHLSAVACARTRKVEPCEGFHAHNAPLAFLQGQSPGATGWQVPGLVGPLP